MDFTMDRRALLSSGIGLCIGGGLATDALALSPRGKINIVCTSSSIQLTITELMTRMGFLKKLGLDATIAHVPDGSRLLAALLSGDMDICISSGFAQIYPAIEKGAKMKIIAGANTVVAQAVYSAKPYIRRLKDLEGRNVGSGSPGSLLHSSMVAAMIKEGVDYKKVNFVNVGSNSDVFKAVAVGKVDAGASTVDVYFDQAKYGVHVVAEMWKVIPDYPYQGAYATDAAIAAKRNTLIRTLAAYAQLYRFMMRPESRQPWIDAYLTAAGKDAKHAEDLWRFNQQAQSYAVNLTVPDSRLEYLQKLNLLLGVQHKEIPMNMLRDMSLAEEAVRAIGTYHLPPKSPMA
jgi:ABC-type nitrate/sulfonate/bicarbonate transport system substrate-binding protein